MFFTFDGVDGVGKTTQIRLLCEWLRGRGLTVCECRDPGSTPLGECVRDIVLHAPDDTPISARSEMLLYMAARAQLVEEVIRPALARGEVVVSDRYLLANVVYQGHAGGLDPELVKSVGEAAVHGLHPDATFLLDMDPAEADSRMQRDRDRMESRGDDYRRRVREGFLAEARLVPERVHVVDAARTIEQVSGEIRGIAEKLI
ncbi:Thymidylate kinase [Posidoniimonas polymericola]|uniref:Thymidylate kinase n=1 Tax=Posidoniimonas polymericola TaxID=2528002 RepID=A0A5C5YUL6_9BACT|nr:dTMP kinase [Posidoniimonas polymericola]TWT78521.1 Thymidylate kinase [Posidoniimonas polymericola]